MVDPAEPVGGAKGMVLKMLTHLGAFLRLSEAVLDNLTGDAKGALPSSELQKGISDTRGESRPPSAATSRIMLAERRQIRFNQIPLIKP